MTEKPLYNCAVCPVKTPTLCGGCKSIAFCSKEHQKLLWPTHKYACKNGGVWTTAPLSEEEVTALLDWRNTVSMEWLNQCLLKTKELKDLTVLGGHREQDFTVVEKIKRLGLYDGRWEDLLDDLSKPSSSIKDPERSAILSLIRHRLTGCTSLMTDSGAPLGDSISNAIQHKLEVGPWNHMCETAMRFVEPVNVPQDVQLEPGLKLFQQAYPFFQQMLVAHTLSFAYWDTKHLTIRRYAFLAFDRARDMLLSLTLPPPFRRELEDSIRRTRELIDQGEDSAGLPEWK
ncbi:hypothetical protein JCM6882_008256 [Rhodosporidiobolus microsporus]